MSQDQGPDEAEEWARRALAEARLDTPVPPEVAARLDDRLAGLVAERASARPPAPRSSARRLRVGPVVLAAAAVAAVVAVAVPVVRGMGDGLQTTSRGSASSASKQAGTDPESDAGGSSASGSASPQGLAPSARVGLTHVPQLTSGRFGAGVEQSLPQLRQAAAAYALGGTETSSSCSARPAAGATGALALVDGKPVLVELGAVSGGERSVRALSCADGSVVASATVPAS
ncbi:hypothetical protein D9V37_18630 [Nocardioides mangrovicus]|uniref:Uncharacterized protein n=1 Tax=Nocardioides mangrovicus TaxID=2478913 RepID=A0A3L8P0I8_9ACTN|nr:hypothetical protein [Nocardioides mangrovicus]RLV48099.1 hypothetical protein D9V37_18630 [Nocardioides mangrovicus]